MRTCGRCGASLAGDARFCGACGADQPAPEDPPTAESPTSAITSTFGESRATGSSHPGPSPHDRERQDAPEEADPEPGSGRAWRLVLLTLVALAVAAGAAIAVVSLVDRGPSDRTLALNALERDARAFEEVVDELGSAERVAALVEVGGLAADRLPALERSGEEFEALDDASVKDVAVRANVRMVAITRGLSLLRGLDERDLMPWTKVADGVLQASNALRDGLADEVDALARRGERPPLRIPHAKVRDATLQAARHLRSAHGTLEDWRADRRRYRRESTTARREAGAYRSRVSDLLAQYDATRADMQRYMDAVKDEGSSIPAFVSEVSASGDTRRRIRAELEGLTSQAPRRVRDAHGGLIGLLDDALGAIQTALELADSISLLRDFGDDETSAFELSEYDLFQEQSAAITDRFGRVVNEWRQAIGSYIQAIGKNPPERPAV